jgi:thioredoxin-related protein
MRKLIVFVWLALLLGGISYLFWYNEWKYSLPTPVPAKYHPAALGSYVDLGNKIAAIPGKPLFIHFFNPECPCSRFNIKHFKSLVKQYKSQLSFAIVVINKDRSYTAQEIQNKFNLDIPIYFDENIAKRCGVYSTPQAVLLDGASRLYYRGNYNKSRYCTDKNSNYAQQAVDSLLMNNQHPVFSMYAMKAYGCELPKCTKP